MMATRQSHIVMKAHGEPAVGFAMVPLTEGLARNILEQHASLVAFAQDTPKLVSAGFWNGAPVFFDAPGFLPRREEPGDLDTLLGDVLAGGYVVARNRPPIPWHWFRAIDCSTVVIERDDVCWQGYRGELVITTSQVPITVIAARINPYLKRNSQPFAALADGTPLYPAHYPLRRGENYRRSMCWWNGAEGEWVGTTLDGQLYRQCRVWGGDDTRSHRWKKFKLLY
jgi:hypothetical protein